VCSSDLGLLDARIAVMKYNGTHWERLGGLWVSDGASQWPTIALDSNNTPYVTYNDGSVNQGTMMVKKYNGYEWVRAGDFLNIRGCNNSIVIDKVGNVYIAVIECDKQRAVTVVKMGTLLPPITGKDSVCVGESVSLSNIISGGKWTSSNDSIAIIDATSGNVTCINSGQVVITYTKDGKVALHKLNVNKKPTLGLYILPEGCVFPGDTVTLYNTISGGKWVSMDTMIAKVTPEGLMTAVNSGTVEFHYSVSNTCGYDESSFNFSVCRLASITTFPVPNNGIFRINVLSDIKEEAIIVVTDRFGAKIKEFSILTNTDTKIDLECTSGLYFVRAVTAHGEVKSKIIIQ
jgi:hypothetical protein